jgi:putative transposase
MFRRTENKNLCEAILRKLAEKHGIEIIELFVMPDHVHLVVAIPPTMSISKATQLLKGGSAYELFREKPNFRKRYPKGHFWSPGNFYRTIGDVDLETTCDYVRHQEDVHQTKLSAYFQVGSPAF